MESRNKTWANTDMKTVKELSLNREIHGTSMDLQDEVQQEMQLRKHPETQGSLGLGPPDLGGASQEGVTRAPTWLDTRHPRHRTTWLRIHGNSGHRHAGHWHLQVTS